MRILIGEHDPAAAEQLESLLARWGHEVIVARDVNTARQALMTPDAPRLALLNWTMPGLDGFQTCRDVRAREEELHVYILAMAPRSRRVEMAEALEAGADDCLGSPVDPDELWARLRAAARILDQQERLLASRRAAESPARYDALTGVWNPTAIRQILKRELSRHAETGMPVGLIVAQLRGFRLLSGCHGPQETDLVLSQVARQLSAAASVHALVGRYGPSSFLIVAPGCGLAESLALAVQLRESVGSRTVDTLRGAVHATVNLAVATADQLAEVEVDSALRALEFALDRARAARDDRIETVASVLDEAPAPLPPPPVWDRATGPVQPFIFGQLSQWPRSNPAQN